MKNFQPVFIREVVIKAIRQFFDQQHFHEVMVPVFNTALPLEPNIYAFETVWHTANGQQKLYLTTSPESGLKKLLAEGIGNCYAIGKCFRNLENSGTKHNPEFFMLEWYREGAEYEQIMHDSEELIRFVKKQVDLFLQRTPSPELQYQNQVFGLAGHWPVFSLEALFQEHAQLQYQKIIADAQLVQAAREKGYETTGATWSQLFDQIFLNEVEPHLPTQPFFLIDFPARLSPLCKVHAQKKYLADRFELYFGKLEIANGNNENTDASGVEKQFVAEAKKRVEVSQVAHPIDRNFIEALHSMSKKSYAGIGLGVDRLAMLMADVTELAEVEPFVQSSL